MKSFIKSRYKDYLALMLSCALISGAAFFARPHDCKDTYGPPPYYYNTDLTLWVHLAEHPIANLDSSILSNRPLFAMLGWLFAQPVSWLLGDQSISSPTRASGVTAVNLPTVAGLLLANIFCYLVTVWIFYEFTLRLFKQRQIAMLTAFLWAVSNYAFA